MVSPSRNEAQGGLAVVQADPRSGLALLVAGMNGPNRLYRLRSGRLRDEADPVLADSGSATLAVAGADVDRDGREEIYLQNSEVAAGPKRAQDRLLTRLGAGWLDRFDDPYVEPLLNRIAARSVVAFDRKGGGKYGFLVAAYGGPVRLFELDASHGRLVDSAAAVHLDEMVGGNGFAIATLDGEETGLFVACGVGPDLFFRAGPERTYAEIGASTGLCAEPGSRAALPVDLDHDGRLDLLLAGIDGPHRMMVRGAGQDWADIAPPLFAEPSAVRGVVVADFDNDGFQEIFLHHQGEPNRLFGWREGNWRSLDPGDALEPSEAGLACVAADLDGDGRLELVTSYGEGGTGRLGWFKLAKDPGHHWIRIAPVTAAGAPARGARVTLEAGGRRQVRMIDTGAGYLSQGEPVAHFGLGRERRVDRVTVLWPDGTEISLTHLAADRAHPVQHPARLRDPVGRFSR
ncbi:CRTAC1 family protein [Geminicoccus roseus]|uniref:CRTAC1 family protein n=1 Tax=Geminicoccus roseus TaxID=404900 RepID=UPI000688AAA2|nr:CRTAC1 family protein [Geminicoccus roseus]